MTRVPFYEQISSQWFRLAYALKWLSKNTLDQLVDTLQKFAVMLLKPQGVVPCGRSED